MIESMIGKSRWQADEDDLKIGHSRAVYRPLLIYGRLISPEVDRSESLMRSCEDLETNPSSDYPTAMWSALALLVAGTSFNRPGWVATSEQTFADLILLQQMNGTFLPPDATANPEARWYDELILLHAVSSFAGHSGDQAAKNAVARSAAYHLHETQPDHASAQPWGLLAFILHARPLADQVLHAAAMQYPNGVTGVSLLLLTDVLYGLRQLQPTTNL